MLVAQRFAPPFVQLGDDALYSKITRGIKGNEVEMRFEESRPDPHELRTDHKNNIRHCFISKKSHLIIDSIRPGMTEARGAITNKIIFILRLLLSAAAIRANYSRCDVMEDGRRSGREGSPLSCVLSVLSCWIVGSVR